MWIDKDCKYVALESPKFILGVTRIYISCLKLNTKVADPLSVCLERRTPPLQSPDGGYSRVTTSQAAGAVWFGIWCVSIAKLESSNNVAGNISVPTFRVKLLPSANRTELARSM